MGIRRNDVKRINQTFLKLNPFSNNGVAVVRYFRASVAILSLLLAACGGGSSTSYSTTVTNFKVTPGDGQVVITWDSHPGQYYDLYFKVGSNVTESDFEGLKLSITSPYTLINLTNQTQYSFILTATNSGGVAGLPTPVVSATPGSSGTGLSWTVNPPLAVQALRGVASGGNTLVAVGVAIDNISPVVYSSQYSPTSTGGITAWTQALTLPVGLTKSLAAVVFDGTRFVALGINGSVITSGDSVTWKEATAVNAGRAVNGIAYGAGTYVVIGSGGYIATNTAGANNPGNNDPTSTTSEIITGPWTPRTSGMTQDLYGIAYVNGDFIAVGQQGKMLTSHNGITWTPRNTGTGNDLWQVAYGAGTYVAVGDSGTIISSADSATWTKQTSPTTNSLYAIGFGGNDTFVAAGDLGAIAYSTSGADGSWTLTAAGSNALYGITANGTFVAVGAAGATVSGR